jgi:hypothetical protein
VADGEQGDLRGQQEVPLDVAAHLLEVRLIERRVGRAAAREHHVVDPRGEAVEEALEPVGIGGVERCGAQCAELAPGVLEALGVAAGDDDLGAYGARLPGVLNPMPALPPMTR